MAYIWGGNSGIATPEEAKRLREVADALAVQRRFPQNVGEGLSAIGQAISARRSRMRADKMESEGRAAWQSKYGDLLPSLFGATGGAVDPVPEAPGGVVPPQPDLSQAHPEYLTGGGMPPPPSATNVANLQLPPAEDLNAMVRTVIGEAGNQTPEGQRAVAEVILNRARESGMTPQQVVMAKGQFEPWMTRGNELNAIDPNSAQYQSVLANITPAFGPDDPTGGADHFYSPGAQAALGRPVPSWAQGQQGRDIGGHRFYSLGYGGDAGSTAAQDAVTAMAGGQPQASISIDADPNPGGGPSPGGGAGGPSTGSGQAVQLAGGPGFDPRIAEALSDPWLPDGQKAVLQAILEQQLKNNAPVDYSFVEINGSLYRENPRTGQVEKVADVPKSRDPYTLSPGEVRFGPDDKQVNAVPPKEASPLVTVNTGDVGVGEKQLQESLGKKEGERWDAIQQAGLTSGSMAQDFEVLDRLMTVAPQSPLTGPFLQAFPGLSTTGAAFQSIVTRIAPSLRTPGSGATSDLEYEGMLNSLPRLQNYPEANQLIAEVMKAKAALNVERSDVVTAYQNGEIGSKEARSKLAELNKRSIMSPRMKALLDAQGAKDPKDMTDEELLQSLGGQ